VILLADILPGCLIHLLNSTINFIY
jgi:hypothetical protein